jgi:hypothetical protein
MRPHDAAQTPIAIDTAARLLSRASLMPILHFTPTRPSQPR